ncbi:MAG TPA: tyrosine-type recombinase/integrase [Streptosporangiaceae bacterium]|nr:tyrosine-type recombinase/integrase [Streptosporangiaceae bacterium]
MSAGTGRAWVRPSSKNKDRPKSRHRWEVTYIDPLTGRKRTKGGFTKRHGDDKTTCAEAWKRDFLRRVDGGTYRPDEAGQITFEVAALEWLKTKQGLKKSVHNTYKSTITGQRSWVRQRFATAPIGNIRREDIQAFIAEMEQAGRSPQTIRNNYYVISQVMEEQVIRDRIPRNPCTGITLPRLVTYAERDDDGELHFLTRAEVATLASKLPDPFGLLVILTAYTGLRAGEVCGLELRDIDLRAGTLRVRREVVDVNGILTIDTPKSQRSRRIRPLPPFLVALLEPYITDHKRAARDWFAAHPELKYPGDDRLPLFIGTAAGRRGKNKATGEFDVIRWDYTKRLRHNAWYGREWRRAVRLARLSDAVVFHDLRHTHASWLREAGLQIEEISAALGHESVKTTMDIYVHFREERSLDNQRTALEGLYNEHATQQQGNVIQLRRKAK